ncbi:molybdopterin cofactor-binding domain-containing protein, partial [Rhizobiaceae sp. 2RAB30]
MSMQALPKSLVDNPELRRWLSFEHPGRIMVRSGKVELGQGIATALAQIAAEELDVAVERIDMVPSDTARSPDEGLTAGSQSVEQSGSAIRLAAAQSRAALLLAASS